MILGITGGIACGKTEVGRIFSEEGYAVLDTDYLAHELMKKGTPVYEQVVRHFGRLVLRADGELDRGLLGKIVFEDPVARERLNGWIHPAVIEEAEQWKEANRRGGNPAVVLIPLLFETDWTEGWDAILCVRSEKKEIFQRLKERGLSHEMASQRIAAQMPLADKEAAADFTIRNNGTLKALREETLRVLECVRKKRNPHE